MYKTHHARTTLEVGGWKNSTLVWREADVQFKMYKTNEHPTTFGTWDMKQLHVAVAQSTLASQNVQKTASLKSQTIFGIADVEKLQAAVARSTLASQNVKNIRGLGHFWKC